MKTILTYLCSLIIRTPQKMILYTLLCACVFSSLLFVAKIDLSFYTLLHDKHPLIARYIQLNTDLQLAKRLYVVVHDTTEDNSTIPQIMEDMKNMKELESVEVFPYDWIRESSPWIIDRETFNTIENLSHLRLKDALLEFQQQADMLENNDSTLFTTPHTHLLLATLTEDPMNQPMGQSSMKEVQEALKDLENKYSVTIQYTGLPAISYEDQSKTLNRISWLSPLSLLLVLLIVWKIERRPMYLFAIAVVMLISMTSTLGIISVIAKKLTILETVFGIMIFGLGVDFAVHLQSRFIQEMHKIPIDIEWTERVHQAISNTLHTAGHSVVMGAGTTIGAFAIISTAPDPEAFHLGLSGAIGLFVCVICMLIIVPSVWKLYTRETNTHNSAETTYTSYTWIHNTAYISVRYPKTCLGISVICLLSAMGQFSKLHIETDLEKIFNRDIPALTVNDALEKEFHVHFNPWVLSASNLSELQEKHQQCSQLDFVGNVESFASFISPDQEERLEQLHLHKNERQTQLQQVSSLIAMHSLRIPNNNASDMESLVQWAQILEILEEAHHTIPTIETTPKFFRDNLQLPDNRLLLFVYPKHASMDGKILQEQRLALEKIDPNVAGLGTAIEGVLFTERPWLWSTSIAILLFLCGYIAIDIKQPRYIILTLLPVIFGSACTLGILCATEIDCSPITLLAIPLLLGLGIDDGIHVVHKILEDTTEPLEQSISSIGQAILFTTITSCASFAVLLCTDHPGMESLGLVLLIGLPCCFIASITIVPALHQLLFTKQNQ